MTRAAPGKKKKKASKKSAKSCGRARGRGLLSGPARRKAAMAWAVEQILAHRDPVRVAEELCKQGRPWRKYRLSVDGSAGPSARAIAKDAMVEAARLLSLREVEARAAAIDAADPVRDGESAEQRRARQDEEQLEIYRTRCKNLYTKGEELIGDAPGYLTGALSAAERIAASYGIATRRESTEHTGSVGVTVVHEGEFLRSFEAARRLFERIGARLPEPRAEFALPEDTEEEER